MTVSPRLSFKGYNLGTALYRNKDSIKGILAILGAINIATGVDWKVVLISVASGVAALGIKILADAVDYFFGEVELDA